MCYDTVRHEMVLFGGLRTSFLVSLKDTWVYRGNGPGHGVWIQKRDLKTSFSPDYAARDGHAMVFDSRRGVAVMVGGTTDKSTGAGAPPDQRVSEVWEWNGETWSYLSQLFGVRAGPYYEGPNLHAMTYDSDTGTISVSGGGYYYFLTGEFDKWNDLDWPSLFTIRRTEFSYVSQNPGRPFGTGIGRRQQHAAVYDVHRKRIVIFGGVAGEDSPDGDPGNRHDEAVFIPGDPGEYSATRLNIVTPPAREGHGMVYDIRRQRAVLFGGLRGSTAYNDTWEYGLGAIPVIYVDGKNPGVPQPHPTVRQAASFVDDCPAILSIQAGDYPEGALTINKSITLEARNGTVYIH
ncbi:MAG: hypothetical protein L0Z50_32870, partial [Verrucomicrobiales bacterium]|nr:hypothetical protein [Verrucomicrobiales bacterium]